MLNPQFWPAWLAIAIASVVGLGQLLTESEKVANLFGKWGRKIYNKARQRNRMDTEEFNRAVRDAVAEERERWERDEARALTIVEGEVKIVSDVAADQQRKMEEMYWTIRCLTAYTEYEADWHHRLRILVLQANANGGSIPISDFADHIHYAEFEKKCREHNNMNWRSWKELD